MYICDGCNEAGEVWSYYCEEVTLISIQNVLLEKRKRLKTSRMKIMKQLRRRQRKEEMPKNDGSVMVRSVIKPESYYIVVLLSMTRLEQFFFLGGCFRA
ncbi:hypothetical protein NL676_022528 [Syzygium grande]|nr:hypothetical protein NL676_022528 [Syzygium grande]